MRCQSSLFHLCTLNSKEALVLSSFDDEVWWGRGRTQVVRIPVRLEARFHVLSFRICRSLVCVSLEIFRQLL